MTKQQPSKTSEEWQKEYRTKVLDPDGWDRTGDFDYSWYREPITRAEFERRMCLSTCELYIEEETDE